MGHQSSGLPALGLENKGEMANAARCGVKCANMHIGHMASWTVTCEAATLTKAVGATEVPTATGNHPLLFKAHIKFIPRWMHNITQLEGSPALKIWCVSQADLELSHC